jgi:hypothetical protein
LVTLSRAATAFRTKAATTSKPPLVVDGLAVDEQSLDGGAP